MLHKATICKSFDFPAAHANSHHAGLCSNIHGHTWILEVYAHGRLVCDVEAPDYGMVMDFTRLKEIYAEVIEPFVEHQFINETLPMLSEFTSEIISGWALNELHVADKRIFKVRLWEGKTSWVEVCLGDIGIRETPVL